MGVARELQDAWYTSHLAYFPSVPLQHLDRNHFFLFFSSPLLDADCQKNTGSLLSWSRVWDAAQPEPLFLSWLSHLQDFTFLFICISDWELCLLTFTPGFDLYTLFKPADFYLDVFFSSNRQLTVCFLLTGFLHFLPISCTFKSIFSGVCDIRTSEKS